DQRADHPGHALRHARVADALRAVAGERAAVAVVLGLGLREALVLGDPVEAVRSGGGVVAHDPGQQQRDQYAGDHEGPSGHAFHVGAPSVVRTSRARRSSTRRAPCTRSGRTATMLPTARPVIRASPTPISTCQPTIAVTSVSSGMSACPPTAYSPVKQSAATGTETRAATAAAGATIDSRLGSSACRPRKTR